MSSESFFDNFNLKLIYKCKHKISYLTKPHSSVVLPPYNPPRLLQLSVLKLTVDLKTKVLHTQEYQLKLELLRWVPIWDSVKAKLIKLLCQCPISAECNQLKPSKDSVDHYHQRLKLQHHNHLSDGQATSNLKLLDLVSWWAHQSNHQSSNQLHISRKAWTQWT